ncbi:hypothetical protein FQN54_003812 [Arachnomyces sp. PD_36]|nr:hypothetical protein FQN54_003812 [Arachnomyces sp. PD_36]
MSTVGVIASLRMSIVDFIAVFSMFSVAVFQIVDVAASLRKSIAGVIASLRMSIVDFIVVFNMFSVAVIQIADVVVSLSMSIVDVIVVFSMFSCVIVICALFSAIAFTTAQTVFPAAAVSEGDKILC